MSYQRDSVAARCNGIIERGLARMGIHDHGTARRSTWTHVSGVVYPGQRPEGKSLTRRQRERAESAERKAAERRDLMRRLITFWENATPAERSAQRAGEVAGCCQKLAAYMLRAAGYPLRNGRPRKTEVVA